MSGLGENTYHAAATNLAALLTRQKTEQVDIQIHIEGAPGDELDEDRLVMAISAATVRFAIKHLENGFGSLALGLLDSVADQLHSQSRAVTKIMEQDLNVCPECGHATQGSPPPQDSPPTGQRGTDRPPAG